MSSGRDVYLERLADEAKEKYKKTVIVENRLDTPHEVTYYCRVNGDKISWGYMKQIDDNLKIVYNSNNKSFVVEYL